MRWCSYLNLSSSNIPRCLCIKVELTGILLKYTLGWNDFIFSLLNIISCACLPGPWLKLIFHWKFQLLINFRSLLISLAEVLTSWTTENKEVSSANKLHSSFGKSLTNKRGPRMELCDTPAQISTQKEYWSFKTPPYFLLVKKLFGILIRSPHIRFWLSF